MNSSSDSDSDPEGGELPEIISYKKEEETISKKKLKKKRTEKTVEERVHKVTRKREVNILLYLFQLIHTLCYCNELKQSKNKTLILR